MGLQKDVENRMGESVDNLSYSTAHRWANKYSVKFSQYNRTKWKFR